MKSTTHPEASRPQQNSRRHLLRRILLGTVYLLALFSLIVWEYRDRFDILSSECDTTKTETASSFYSAPYKRLLRWASSDSAGYVSLIAVPVDLEDIQGNVCQARGYFADMLQTVAAQHPAEIVLDKIYGPTACAASPETTRDLIDVIRSIPVPVIIGESTDAAPKERDDACLIRKPQLDFAAPNVHHGLTRLNVEAEKIPLQWRVLAADSADSHPTAQLADSLPLAAVKAYDPDFAQRPRLQSLIASGMQPYAHLTTEIPRQTSTQLFCDAGTPDMRKRWSVDCSAPRKHLNLLGKVVVLGSEQEQDHRLVLGTMLFGCDLQARYIDALLSGSYLREVPFWLAFTLFAAFVFFIEGLPTILEAVRPAWRSNRWIASAFQRRRYAWVIFWALAFLAVPTVLCLFVGYLPPMPVFGDILLVAITRLLFFAAETFEHPLVHSHPHAHPAPRKVHHE
jgi:hypothetical protein